MGIFRIHVHDALKVNRLSIIIVLLSFLFLTGISADENSPSENDQTKPRKLRDGNIMTPTVANIWSRYTGNGGEFSHPEIFLFNLTSEVSRRVVMSQA